MISLRPFEIDEILKALYDQFKDDLNYWESSFVGSIQMQWTRTRYLTGPQQQKLSDIWEGFASGKRRRALGAES